MSDPITRLNAALEGRYRIERQLGEGGMATVYLADDVRHERKVALKVLRPELAAVVGAERFLAEIKTTANLQHPHILPLFDSGEADKFLFYVMPYVEGDTLRQRVDREKQLGVDEALAITRKVASALDYAHKHGVVHRDVKPGNILLSEQGEPLVADFGIALAVAQAGGGRITETGLSLGTPHYMAPEQATGDRDVDKRADVYSLGCVLYEMLAGEPPFSASTAQAILAKILTMDAPSITMVRRTVSPNVGAALAKALEKLPADRFTSAADFSAALADSGFTYEARRRTSAAEAPAAVGMVSAAAGPWKRLSIALASLLAVATGVAAWALLQPEPPRPVSRQYLSTDGWAGHIQPFGNTVAISPDGSRVVLPMESATGDWQLGLKLRESTEVTPIPGTDNAQSVAFSPDGEWIVYQARSGTELVKRPLVGGAPVTLATDVARGLAGVAWLDDGTILYDQEVGDRGTARAMRISENGGEPLGVAFELAEIFYITGLPGARGAIVMGCSEYNCGTDREENLGVYIVDLRDGSSERALTGAARAWYSPTGHLLYVRGDGAVLAAGFDLGSLSVSGAGVPLFEGVRVASDLQDPAIAVGAEGTALYVEGIAGGVRVQMRLAVVDTTGSEEVLTLPPRRIDAVSWLPDGRTVVYVSDQQLYTYDTELRTTPRRLTSTGINTRPVASPDGRQLVFSGRRNDSPQWDLYVLSLDDPDIEARQIVALSGEEYATQWPTDSVILFEHREPGQNRDLWIADLANPAEPQTRVYLPQEADDAGVSISPDGTLAAYASVESGTVGAYIRAFPGGEGPLLVGAVRGLNCCPFWSPDGNTLYWGTLDGAQGRAWLRARLRRTPALEVMSADTVFVGPYLPPSYGALHPDGDRWIVRERAGGGPEDVAAQKVVFVENLFEELKRLEP